MIRSEEELLITDRFGRRTLHFANVKSKSILLERAGVTFWFHAWEDSRGRQFLESWHDSCSKRLVLLIKAGDKTLREKYMDNYLQCEIPRKRIRTSLFVWDPRRKITQGKPAERRDKNYETGHRLGKKRKERING